MNSSNKWLQGLNNQQSVGVPTSSSYNPMDALQSAGIKEIGMNPFSWDSTQKGNITALNNMYSNTGNMSGKDLGALNNSVVASYEKNPDMFGFGGLDGGPSKTGVSGKLGDLMPGADTMKGLGLGADIFKSLLGGVMGYKNYGLAKSSYKDARADLQANRDAINKESARIDAQRASANSSFSRDL